MFIDKKVITGLVVGVIACLAIFNLWYGIQIVKTSQAVRNEILLGVNAYGYLSQGVNAGALPQTFIQPEVAPEVTE